MLKLVIIDLHAANIGLFESYERKIIPLLDKYGARMEVGVRSLDRMTETHLLYFPDHQCFDRFLADPARVALQADWQLTGATTTVSDVADIDYIEATASLPVTPN